MATINIDRLLNIQQSYTQAKISALNKEILKAQYYQSTQINALQHEMEVANAISKEILQNQLRELKEKEKQKFYKNLSFNVNELIIFIGKIDELPVRYFLFNSFSILLKTNIEEAIDSLNEIYDKTYCSEILTKINQMEESFSSFVDEYKRTDFSNLLILEKSYSEFEIENENRKCKLEIEKNEKEKNKEKGSKRKIEIEPLDKASHKTAIIISLVLTLLSLFFIITSLTIPPIDPSLTKSFILLFLIPSILFFYLSIRSKRKWHKNYPEYLKFKNRQLNYNVQSSKDFELEIENLNSEIETLNNQLENHPYIVAKKSISILYPNWENIIQGAHQIYSKATKNLNIKNEGSIKRDPLFNEAAHLIVANQQGSSSLIQRKFSIGYNRAERILNQLEVARIISPSNGSRERKVLILNNNHLELLLKRL